MTFQFGEKKAERIRDLYRLAVCLISVTVLVCCALLYFAREFTAANIAKRFLFSVESPSDKQAVPDRSTQDNDENLRLPNNIISDEGEQPESGGDGGPPEYMYPITELDLSCGNDRFSLRNGETDYEPDLEDLLTAPYPEELKNACDTDGPLVLVIHTHATESFAEDAADGYNDDTPFRSRDTEKNMVAVGEEFCRILDEQGIETLHCTELFDDPDYNASYTNSLAAVREYLARYPSIKYIFDLHRDAIIRENKDMIKGVTEYGKENAAQVMLVVGTDYRGADHPDWRENLSVAVKLQDKLCGSVPGLMRSIDLRGASFNQQYSPGFLLIEIGSCGNTLEEAKNAARLVAGGVGEMITENE